MGGVAQSTQTAQDVASQLTETAQEVASQSTVTVQVLETTETAFSAAQLSQERESRTNDYVSLSDDTDYYYQVPEVTQSTETIQVPSALPSVLPSVLPSSLPLALQSALPSAPPSAPPSAELIVQNEQVQSQQETTETVVVEWPPETTLSQQETNEIVAVVESLLAPVDIKCGTFALGMYFYLDAGLCYDLAGNWWDQKISWIRGESAGGACVEVRDDTSTETYCGNEWAELPDTSMQVSTVCCFLQ